MTNNSWIYSNTLILTTSIYLSSEILFARMSGGSKMIHASLRMEQSESLMLGGINQKQDGWLMFESKDITVK